MRRWLMALVVGLLLLPTIPTDAREVRQGDQCVVAANEVITQDLFVLCRILLVEGRVTGSLTGAVVEARIRGTVEGDIYLLGGQLEISGQAADDVHFAGAVFNALPTSTLGGDLISLSINALVEAPALTGSVTGIGYQMALDGAVGREVNYWGSALHINGLVRGDVEAHVGDPQSGIAQLQTVLSFLRWQVDLLNPGLVIGQTGIIEGQLAYSAPAEGQILGRVTGDVMFTPTDVTPDITQIINAEEEDGLRLFLAHVFREFTGLAAIGIIALLWFKRPFQAPLRPLQNRPVLSLGTGLLTLLASFLLVLLVLVVVIALIVLLATLQLENSLTLSLSALAGSLWLISTSSFYFAALFISRVLVAFFIGRLLVRVAIGDDGSQRIAFASLFVGLLITAILISLPGFGTLISWLAALIGLGAMTLAVQQALQALRYPSALPLRPPIPPAQRSGIILPPPPPLDDSAAPPGMDNLPPGFRWWDD